MRQVYLDNNATTPVDSRVLETMLPYFSEHFANAASIHGPGQMANAAIEKAREQVARLIGVQSRDVVFTSGGTEADNCAIRGVAARFGSRGNHIITTTIEHPAVLRVCEQLEEEGIRVTYVAVDSSGQIRMDELERSITPQTILISVMYANNEVGSIQPVEAIAALARQHGILFHTDAVQAAGKIPVDGGRLEVDLLSLSSHKIHGPKGVGALYVRPGVELAPFMLGGTHERHRRAGTHNVPGIVGLGKACELAGEQLDEFQARVRRLRDRLEQGILESVPDTHINGTREQRVPHVSNITFRKAEGEALLVALDFQGISVSTGAACSSGSLAASHVLTAMGLSSMEINGAIRFSLSRDNSEEDIDYVLGVLPGLLSRMHELAPVPHS